ncbi:hypothetical protein PHMEG_00011810 [Phytophthora megakarya]|uniref:DUF659 domain-containing protein n=1 Tax=Phytophthora megakarya TaxID=4795 RepID=A0A225WCF9_9STRA|nr:hypothetical protein PHMEG_00011810 [Phytophthora megakarya]
MRTADTHVQPFKSILDVYSKFTEDFGFLVGVNCNTNLSIVTKMEIPLVGCTSHCLNLAVNKVLDRHEALLSDVKEPKVELRKENSFAELQKHTRLLSVKRYVTRQSSTFTTFQLYIRIRPEIKKVEAVEEMKATGAKHLSYVLFAAGSGDLAELRVMFDALIAEYPVMSEHLKAMARIVWTPAFESGVVCVIRGCVLSSAEEPVLKNFEQGDREKKITRPPTAK